MSVLYVTIVGDIGVLHGELVFTHACVLVDDRNVVLLAGDYLSMRDHESVNRQPYYLEVGPYARRIFSFAMNQIY